MKQIIFTLLLSITITGLAMINDPVSEQYDEDIEQIYQQLQQQQLNNTAERVDFISSQFLGKPYGLDALGEGSYGRFDQNPRYRSDAFDCLTYVSTVLALTQADNLDQFKQVINKVRYKNADVAYVNRNHFTSLDWNINNEDNGYIKDITMEIKDKRGRPLALMASAFIDKQNWYRNKKAASIHRQDGDTSQQQLAAMQALSQRVTNDIAQIPYIPLSAMYDEQRRPIDMVFDQIPSGAIVEIIRPNWDLQQAIGTNLNVSHLGFAIRTDGGLMFREASSIEDKVVDIPLDRYLQNYLNSPTLKGINVQIVVKE